jgi:hypothetical protein
MKLLEQLTLITLQTAHHGSTSSRFALTLENHGVIAVSTDFCKKICQTRTSTLQTVRKLQKQKAAQRRLLNSKLMISGGHQCRFPAIGAMNANAREPGADPAVQVVRIET